MKEANSDLKKKPHWFVFYTFQRACGMSFRVVCVFPLQQDAALQ